MHKKINYIKLYKQRIVCKQPRVKFEEEKNSNVNTLNIQGTQIRLDFSTEPNP